LRREEADEIIEEVDAQAVGDDKPAVNVKHAEGVETEHDDEEDPAEADVNGGAVKDVLPFSVCVCGEGGGMVMCEWER